MTGPTCTALGCAQPLDRRGRNVSGLCRRHARDLGNAPEALAKRAASMRAYTARTHLAWCPAEHHDGYFHLTRVKRLPAAEARAITEREIAAGARRYAATGVLPQFQPSLETSL